MVPMKAIAESFEEATGHQVRLSFGSSGKLYAQILNGAPFDLFLSADQTKPEALEKAELVSSNGRQTYAIGKLVLAKSPSALKHPDSVTPEVLLKGGTFNRLAIANSRVAPYGQAAKEVLETIGVSEIVSSRIVQGENISQTFQFVATGNADLGFIALSQVLSPNASDFSINSAQVWSVPDHMYSPIYQDMVLLRKAQENPAAIALFDWLKSDETKLLIQSFGYSSAISSAAIAPGTEQEK